MSNQRYVVDPDPAWDLSELRNSTLHVELSWNPDALAGRLEELVASPKLVSALEVAGITGFTSSPAYGYFSSDAIGVTHETVAPELLQLHVGRDGHADLSYLPESGLIASERAVEVIRRHCDKAAIEPLPSAT